MLRNNSEYELQAEEGPYRIYTPVNIAEGYTTERYVQAMHQEMYSNAGITADTLRVIAEDILARCNSTQPTETIRTDVGTLMHNILYRLQNPVDEHCAIRTGAILSFLEYENSDGHTVTEDPRKYDGFWTKKKEGLAFEYPELYAFFLEMGLNNTPQYRQAFDISTNPDYFSHRSETLKTLSIIPKELSETATTVLTNPV